MGHFVKFEPVLQRARFQRRYKRFFADVELECGTVVTAHCPNTGSMRHCFEEAGDVWISSNANPKRKLRYTWELSRCNGHMIGVNTGRANRLVQEAITKGLIPDLDPGTVLRAEATVADSRLDFLANDRNGSTYIEVKSVTLAEPGGQGFFPDTVTTRGARHLDTLRTICEAGGKAMLVFCVQHSGITRVAPAYSIDPVYGRAFDAAVNAGVKIIALGARLSVDEISLYKLLDVDFGGQSG